MQDLASEFSQIFRGWYSQTLTAGGGDPLLHPTLSPAFGRARGHKRPGVGTQTLAPSTFQPRLRPWLSDIHTNCVSKPQLGLLAYLICEITKFINTIEISEPCASCSPQPVASLSLLSPFSLFFTWKTDDFLVTVLKSDDIFSYRLLSPSPTLSLAPSEFFDL